MFFCMVGGVSETGRAAGGSKEKEVCACCVCVCGCKEGQLDVCFLIVCEKKVP